MAASIHNLFAGPAESKPTVPPLLADLRDTALGMLDEVVRRMFDGADDSLFEMGEKAGNDAERRHYFDTMRVLRMDRGRVTREFLHQLELGFAPKPAKPKAVASPELEIDKLSIQSHDDLEQNIALGNLAAKVEGLHKTQLWDLERRLELAFARGIQVNPDVLHPERICEAFGKATQILDTSLEIKLVIFKLFDRVLSSDLGPIYEAAVEVLEREGIDMRRPTSRAVTPASERAATQPVLDLLRGYGVDPGRLLIGDESAAASFREMLQGLLAREGREKFEGTARRLSMAGQLFNDLLAEPLLGDTLKGAFEPLRYPLYRTALADPAFFTSAVHPARKMLGDLIELAAVTQTGEVSIARFRSLLHAMVAKIDGAASQPVDAAVAAAATAPLSGSELGGFLAELREQARVRRNALLLHVRRIIGQEIELRSAGRDIPKTVQSLLRSGIGPLMAMRLLRNGRGSARFREAELMVDRIIESLDAPRPVPPARRLEREQLLAELAVAFQEIGMAEDRSSSLLIGLKLVYAMLDQAPREPGALGPLTDVERARVMADFAPEAAALTAEIAAAQRAATAAIDRGPQAATAMELLGRLLTPESWFRVFDAAQCQTRWLKLASFYPQQNSVTFTGFDESSHLSLRATRLAEDLVRGHSEPINPTASAREALEQLRQIWAGSPA